MTTSPPNADDSAGPPAGANERLSPLLYAELKALAARAMRSEREGHTLQTTALVNEACVRVLGQERIDASNRAQFLGIAAQMMRRVLVDHARRRAASKRPSSDQRIAIDEIDLPAAETDLIGLDGALERLFAINPRQARVVDLKFFAGLELEQIADTLDVARPTVVRDWRMARAWLQRELADA
ncbi:ECF-type sigma factor [Dokdonella sp.]|uniref:ECF-type sigma factor n=1 Tax=Dokdonella sp. TaxID=2291710 RepID=UPI00261FF66A|nr:ECF-type sigma factor [Dokdonella sp.]